MLNNKGADFSQLLSGRSDIGEIPSSVDAD
jgi:hypothetical protein